MSKHPKFIVVIGASAGGLNALMEMVQTLPKGLDVSYCIVLHLSRKGIGDFVVHRLSQVTSLPCSLVINGAPIEKENIYIARPNQHMLVKDNKFILGGVLKKTVSALLLMYCSVRQQLLTVHMQLALS